MIGIIIDIKDVILDGCVLKMNIEKKKKERKRDLFVRSSFFFRFNDSLEDETFRDIFELNLSPYLEVEYR